MKKNLFYLCIIALLITPYLMAAWDKTKPAIDTALNASNPQILDNFSALETTFGGEHEFSTGGTNSGKHLKVTLQERSGDQATSANEMAIYCKDLGSFPALYLRQESNGTVVQLSTGTTTFKLLSASLDSKDEDNMASNSDSHTATQQSVKAYVDSGTVTMTNKTLTSPVLTAPTVNTSISGTAVLDEDDMASDSATQIATQQSIKAYVDNTVGHDGEGYQYFDVSSTKTKVYTKWYCGTTDGDTETNVAHGLTLSKIINVTAQIYDTATTTWYCTDVNLFRIKITTTYLTLYDVNAALQIESYRIKVDYTE